MKIKILQLLAGFACLVAMAASPFAAETNTAIQPVPRESSWMKRHDSFVELAKAGNIDVLFLGDSITDFWRDPKRGKTLWDEHYAPLHAANFGLSGDRTQHVLWRMEHGELDGIHPRAIVLMIGTNNTGFERDKVTLRNTPSEIIEGVAAIVHGLREKLPEAKILLLAIFPRGATNAPERAQIVEINAGIAKLDDGHFVHYLDIGQKFLWPDGTLPKDVMPDLLHPSEIGYAIWAAAIKRPLADLLQ